MRQISKHRTFVTGLAPITPSSSTPDYVNASKLDHVTVIILADNGTTVTGSDITLKQATSAAGAGEKALSFDKVYANTDTAAGHALTETAVSSDTFTVTEADGKNSMYVIEVPVENLDTNNGFKYLRVGTGDATAQVVSVLYVCDAAFKGGTEESLIA